jgi:hypothetical protein
MYERHVWIGGLLGVLLVHPASAATRAMLVVVPAEDRAERQALELERALSDLLASDPRVALVDPSSRYALEATDRTARQLEAGRAALEAVKAAVGRVEYPEARALAAAALAELAGGDFRVLKGLFLELLMQLAAIEHALDVDDRGTAELFQALLIDSKLAVPRGWNSQAKAWFAQTKHAVAATGARPVRLEHDGAPGWVWVDGELVGVTPVTASLRPGRHFFTFSAPGVEEHRSELMGDLERVTFAPEESADGRNYRALRATLASGFRRDDPIDAARALLRWSASDEVLAVAVGATAGASVLRIGASGWVPVTEGAVASPQAVAEVVLQVLERALEQPVRTQPQSVPLKAARSSVPGVVLLAVSAAAVVAGAVLVIEGEDVFAKTKGIPQVETEQYDRAVSRSNILMGAGIGAFGGAALCGGAGMLLLW